MGSGGAGGGDADFNSTIQLVVTAVMGAFIRNGVTTTVNNAAKK